MMLRDCLNIGKSLNAPIRLLYPYNEYNEVIKIFSTNISSQYKIILQILYPRKSALEGELGKRPSGLRAGYLGDEVAHVGQDTPSCQVDFPVS